MLIWPRDCALPGKVLSDIRDAISLFHTSLFFNTAVKSERASHWNKATMVIISERTIQSCRRLKSRLSLRE